MINIFNTEHTMLFLQISLEHLKKGREEIPRKIAQKCHQVEDEQSEEVCTEEQ